MAYEIIVKTRFRKKVVKLLSYLEKEWGKAVADNLLKEIDRRCETLSKQPFIGNPVDETKNVRSILLTKHNRVYYRIRGPVIEIINLYDTRINPKRNIYNR